MTFKEEAELRLKCCREKSSDIYGSIDGLESFLFNAGVDGRVGYLRSHKEDANEISAIKIHPIHKELMRELDELISLRSQARILINKRRAEDVKKTERRAETDHQAVW
jgi:hypothetical protein